MISIIYVGMDVHTTSHTLCCYSIERDETFAIVQVEPSATNVIKYLSQVKRNMGGECEFVCGYEAGSLGYTLYNELTDHDVDCVILAPTTMPRTSKKEIKTDKRDAIKIARCLAYKTYRAVYIPTEEDNAVREYIRMRDDEKGALKKIKQRIQSFCIRQGKPYSEGSAWTQKHMAWLGRLDFGNAILQEAFKECLITLKQTADKVALYDKRIEEFAMAEPYKSDVEKLSCFKGIKAHTALATIVETGDFNRFKTAQQYASYLGLVPGESSSGDSRVRTGITKAGNTHVRKLLIESAQCYARCTAGAKSKALKQRQAGNDPDVIAYADKANDRLKRKFNKIMFRSKRNIAITAVARELACFIWGMMTGKTA